MYPKVLDKNKCCETVPTKGMSFGYHQCTKPVTCTREGKNYCKIHDPTAVEKRRAESSAKWESEYAAKRKKWAIEATAPEMLAILKELDRFFDAWCPTQCSCATKAKPIHDKICKIIKKAETVD